VRVIERIAARIGRRIDTAWPMADLRLPDGSRVNATLPPVTIDGPTLSIRRFGRRRLRRDDLLGLGTLSADILEFWCSRFVRARTSSSPAAPAPASRRCWSPGGIDSRYRAHRDDRGHGGADSGSGARRTHGDTPANIEAVAGSSLAIW